MGICCCGQAYLAMKLFWAQKSSHSPYLYGRSPVWKGLIRTCMGRLNSIIWKSKHRSRSRKTILEITPFDGQSQHLKTFIVTVVISTNVRPVRTKATDRQTDRNGQTIAIGEILQICLTKCIRNLPTSHSFKRHYLHNCFDYCNL